MRELIPYELEYLFSYAADDIAGKPEASEGRGIVHFKPGIAVRRIGEKVF